MQALRTSVATWNDPALPADEPDEASCAFVGPAMPSAG